MSDVMSGADIDAIAAEYVLGTLDADERAHAQSLLTADEAFLAKVKVWERRFGELHLMVEPVEPDGQIWERIKDKMPEVAPDPDSKHSEPAAGEPAVDQPAATASSSELLAPTAADAAPGSSPAASAAPAAGVATAGAREVAAKPASPVAAGAPQIAPARAAAAVLEQRLGRWRALAVLMTVLVGVIAVLLGLWRFAPEQVPVALQPVELMRSMGVELTTSPSGQPPRRRPPPASQFDE